MSETAVVTLLFTDLVGSTELSRRLGEEGAEDLRRSHVDTLRAPIVAHGGKEVKNLGDGLMVAFSSPSQAIGCAVEMQRSVDRHNRRDRRELLLRVGLHLGEVTMDEDDYFGTPVVVAERLCKAADGGRILATEAVRLVAGSRGTYELASIGEVALKGMDDPVLAYEVLWAPEAEPLPQRNVALILARELAESVLTPMWMWDEDGTLVYFNEPAAHLLGQPFDDADGMNIDEIGQFHPEDLDGNPVADAELPSRVALRDHRPAHRLLRITGLDGLKRTIIAVAIPLFGRADQHVGTMTFFWEQSERTKG